MQRILAILLPIIILVGLGIGGSLFIKALAPQAEKAKEKSVSLSVFVETVESKDVQLSITGQGIVKPLREINIAPQVAGKIAYMNPAFQDGGKITAGQVLMRLEQDDYKLGVVRAQAAVASAQQRVYREEAEGTLARKDLDELGFTSASDLALRKPQMAEAKAALDSSKAQLADANLALSRTIIKAPFTGLVSQKMTDAGQFVSPGQTLGRMFDISAFEIYVPIQDAEFSKIGLNVAFSESAQKQGPRVEISGIVSGKPHIWYGRVARTAASIDPLTRQIGVFVRVDDPFGAGRAKGAGTSGGTPLPSGLFVNVEIFGEKITAANIVPRAALRAFNTVYIADKDTHTLEIRKVEVVQTDPEKAILRGGVMPGEYVITSLINGPTEGMQLKLLRNNAQGSVDKIPLKDSREAEGAEAYTTPE